MKFLSLFQSGFRSRTKRTEAVRFATSIVVVGTGPSASMTYFLDPYLAGRGHLATYVSIEEEPPTDLMASGCEMVVVARYLPQRWVRPLELFSAKGGHVVYFMDDDLFDPTAHGDLPRRYAKKIRQLSVKRRAILEQICDEFWVGSTYLAQKYSLLNPLVVTPQPSVEAITPTTNISVCYHGTASHKLEIEWLVPMMTALLAANDNIRFEIFGDHSVNRLYRHLPRVAVLHPMTWPNYLAYTGSVHRNIALAPLLPAPFNTGRGPTKFFDFARMGAVGIYSDSAPYKGFIVDKVDGFLLPNDPAIWLKTIVELSINTPLRERMALAARDRAIALARGASAAIAPIIPSLE